MTTLQRNNASSVSEIDKTIDYVKNMKVGTHGMFVYRNPQEKRDVLFNFLQAGFQRGEGAVYVASQETSKQIRRHLEHFGFNVKRLERDGMLRIFDHDEFYIINGQASPSHTMMLLQRILDDAMEIGLKGLRGCGEAACFFERTQQEALVEWELMVGRKLDLPLTALCAYDMNHARALEEKLLFSIVKAHGPIVTYRFAQELVYETFFSTMMQASLATIFGETGKELLLIMLDKHHSLTPGEREHRIAHDPISFFEGLEEIVGSGAVVVEKSMARQMLQKIGMT